MREIKTTYDYEGSVDGENWVVLDVNMSQFSVRRVSDEIGMPYIRIITTYSFT
jgi:hypothetical protein